MKKFIASILILNALLLASSSENNSSENNGTKNSDTQDKKSAREKRIERNIQKQIAKEKKFGREQAFYHGKEHDLKDSEIDEESVAFIPEIEDDIDFNMDDAYD